MAKKQEKTIYPVIFTPTEGAVLIEVPDLEVLTEGEDLSDALDMARDAICANIFSRETNGEFVPIPSTIDAIDASKGTFADSGHSFVSMVDADLFSYRIRHDKKTVRRNVTIPSWLNQEAIRANVNVSKILQNALLQELNL